MDEGQVQQRPTEPRLEAATAIDKALEVLFYLHAQPEAQGVSEIGRALSLPKSSAHRLLSALRKRELVEQDDSGRYRPGIGLLALAVGVLDRDPLVAAGHAILAEEAAALSETFFLVASRGGRLTVLDKVEGTGLLRASPPVGTEVPVHATAIGKLYLAFAPDEVAKVERPARYTRHTLVGAAKLGREVAQAREQGYAVNREEWIEGLTVVAAPIFCGGRLQGGVCTALATTRLLQLQEVKVVARAVDGAQRIGGRLQGGRT